MSEHLSKLKEKATQKTETPKPIEEEGAEEVIVAPVGEVESEEEKKKGKGKPKKEEVPIELSDEDLLKRLSEKTGVSVKDFAQIKERFQQPLNPEEQERLKEQEFADKLKIAVDLKIATPQQILEWEKLQSEDEEVLTRSEFAKAERKTNPKATDEEINAKYAKYFFQAEPTEDDEDDVKKEKLTWLEIGKNEIKTRGQQIKEKAKRNLDKVNHEVAAFRDLQKKATEYVDTVRKVVDELPIVSSITVINPDTKEEVELEVEYGDEKEVRADLRKYLHLDGVGNSVVAQSKQTDKDYIKSVGKAYLDKQKQDKIYSAILLKGISQGIEIAKIGTTKQIKEHTGEAAGVKTPSKAESAFKKIFSNKEQPVNP